MRRIGDIFFAVALTLALWSCGTSGSARHVLDRAEASLETSPDSAFVALDSLDRNLLNTKELRARHALLYSLALDKVGIEVSSDSIIQIALDYYSKAGDEKNLERARVCLERIETQFGNIDPADTLKVQNARIIEERYSDKMTLVSRTREVRMIVLLSLLALAALGAGSWFVIRRLRRRPDKKAMEVIHQRLAVLDKVIASRISSEEKVYKDSEDELEVMMSDREAFLLSTKVIFDERHPKFTAYLSGRGLTDWEIGYCCLYTLGLKGKDIGEYIRKKRHYIISHEIRHKLGLDEHDTNIGIYLRNLLADLEDGA